MNMINELNNNTIFPINGNAKRRQLGDSIIDTRVDTRGLPGYYKNDDSYKPYTIYGNSGEFSFTFYYFYNFFLILVWSTF